MSETMSKADRLRAALQAQADKASPTSKVNTGDNAAFPIWKIPENTSTTIRLLPDADDDNPFFWAPREIIKLPFAGQVGGDYPTDNQVEVTVPCVDMFEEKTCPIINETRPWWKQGADQEALARLYYKKKSYIFQGFVVSSSFEEESVPENPIRRFVISPSIYEIIKQSVMNPEMEELPTDYVGGRDFKISKTKKDKYANYGTSSWSLRVRPLNEIENVAIQQFGLFDLNQFRGQRPDADGVELIKAMFHDSLAGKPFDFDAYGKFYRAYSRKTDADPDAISSVANNVVDKPRAVAPSRVEHNNDAEVEVKTAVKPSTADILERIRKKTISS